MRPIIVFFLVASGIAFTQPKPKPTFEVASVKLTDANSSPLVGMSADPAVVRYRNLTMRDAIRGAYKIRDFQIVGPDWMSTLRFEVDAKLPAGATAEDVPDMFQSLLEERFKLTYRRDPKELQVFALVVDKNGPKLTRPAPPKEGEPPQGQAMGTDGKPRSIVFFGGNASSVTVTAPNSSLLTLVGVTTRFTSKPVVDETHIDGLYDFSLTFFPEDTSSLGPVPTNAAAPADPAPSLSEAVKKYGLRIENRKATIDQFVVTHIKKTPTDN